MAQLLELGGYVCSPPMETPYYYGSSNKNCPSGRIKESGTNNNLFWWAILGDTIPDSNYLNFGNGNYILTDLDGLLCIS